MSRNPLANVTGLKETERNLRKLHTRTARKAQIKAVKAAAPSTQKAAQRNAMSMVGGSMGTLMAMSLRTRRAARNRAGWYNLRIQPDESYNDLFIEVSREGNRNYIPNAIEYGHTQPNGTHVAPFPFMRTAYTQTRASGRDHMRKTFYSELKKTLK